MRSRWPLSAVVNALSKMPPWSSGKRTSTEGSTHSRKVAASTGAGARPASARTLGTLGTLGTLTRGGGSTLGVGVAALPVDGVFSTLMGPALGVPLRGSVPAQPPTAKTTKSTIERQPIEAHRSRS